MKRYYVNIQRNQVARVFAESADDAIKQVEKMTDDNLKWVTVANDRESVTVKDSGESVEFGFEFAGDWIVNPTASPCGRFIVSPAEYGFSIQNTGGGCTGWMKDLPSDMQMLLTATDDPTHKYGKKFGLGLYDKLSGDCIEYREMEVGVVPGVVGELIPARYSHWFKEEIHALRTDSVCGRKCWDLIDATIKAADLISDEARKLEMIKTASAECNLILFG